MGEFDGAEHRLASRHAHDVGREDRFRRNGLEVFRVTGPDLPRRSLRAAAPCSGCTTRGSERGGAPRPTWLDPRGPLDDLLDHRDLIAELHASDHSARRP